MKINEQYGNQSRIAGTLGNIGNVYLALADYSTAREYHERALAIAEKIKDKKAAAPSYASIGNIYFLQERYGEAAEAEKRRLNWRAKSDC